MADLDREETQLQNQEVHIAGIIVYCDPGRMEAIKSAIGLLPNAEFHVQSPEGKMVVTLESDSTKHTLDCMDAIRALPGVLDISLVYQHAEPAAAMEQEMDT